MANHWIMKIGKLEIEVVRKKIKNLYLRVESPEGIVRITCPQQLDDEAIWQFVERKTHWIEKQQAKFLAQPRKRHLEYFTGEPHYFKGDRYLLNIIYHHAAPKVVIEGTSLNLYVRYNSIPEQKELALTNWYRQQLKTELPRLIAKWSKIIGVSIDDWGVKKMKTRWGTCNVRERRIWLNLELIKHPPISLEYVVVHELVHLLERKHNARFQAYMSQFMPCWKLYQEELNHSSII